MGKPVIGKVVVLPFPHTDLQVGKRRPALVVADLIVVYTAAKVKASKLAEVRSRIRQLFG